MSPQHSQGARKIRLTESFDRTRHRNLYLEFTLGPIDHDNEVDSPPCHTDEYATDNCFCVVLITRSS